jgi:hypothetical protein
MHIRYNGNHTEIAYSYLLQLGYTEDDLQEHGLYRPLISLMSDTNRSQFEQFTDGDEVHAMLYKVLMDHGLSSFLYVLQEFIDTIADNGCLLWEESDLGKWEEAFYNTYKRATKEISEQVEIKFY